MVELQLICDDEVASIALGERLGRAAQAGAVIFFQGRLGAGKTTFCRGVLRAFGYGGAVKSPTYTLVEPYEMEGGSVYHFDLYRLADPEELEYMGVRDYFNSGNLCLIEWSEKGAGFLPEADLEVIIEPLVTGSRRITLSSHGLIGAKIIDALSEL